MSGNRKPIVCGTFEEYRIWPWWVRTPDTSVLNFGNNSGWYFVGILIAATGVGLIPGLVIAHVAARWAEERFLALHGWTAVGPDRTAYGRYKDGVIVERYSYGTDPQVPPAAR